MRRFAAGLLASLIIAAALAAAPALAQEWPQRTIRIVVAYGPGGGTDVVARIVAQGLQEKLGQSVVVENKPGAGGIIGIDSVARSAPDGYTLMVNNNAHVVLPAMNKSLPFDTLHSFDPVGQVGDASLLLVAHPEFRAADVKELIALAKAQPGKITYASVGVGSTQHFTGELFRQIAGVDILHVPYRNSPAAVSAVLGRQVDLLFETVTAVLGQVQSGELKPLLVTGKDRFPAVPEVPTGIESGLLPGYDVTSWYGIQVPAGTPRPIIDKLNAALVAIVADETVRDRLAKIGVLARSSSPEEFGKRMETELARWARVREAAGIPQQ